MKKILCASVLFLLTLGTMAQYQVSVIDSQQYILGEGVLLGRTSFRGLSVPDDKTVWACGSRGTIARSTDAGKTFVFTQLKGYEKSDFRDIEAFDDKRAILMSAGSPSYILKTTDGGSTWTECYKNTDSSYFLDAMDFWDEQNGVVVADPINGHFVLLQTSNGGSSWQEWDSSQTPSAARGESVFAASGTSLRCGTPKNFSFVSGGSRAVFYSCTVVRNTREWTAQTLDMQQGKPSQGAFSFAENKTARIVCGGDYANDTARIGTFQVMQSISYPEVNYSECGYRSCIERITDSLFVACGTSGVSLFSVTGIRELSVLPFHVVCKSKKGNAVFLAGAKGRMAYLKSSLK